MANLDNIVPILRNWGLNVVETSGWITRGYAGQDLQDIRGVLWHHTATNRNRFNGNNAPTLDMCINGRNDLPGPLCNIVFGRDGTVYMVATGVSNHAGVGIADGVPRNMGNHYLIGIEMESSGVAPWDWTPEQLRLAPILGAALETAYLLRLPEAQRLQIGHMEYSSEGKIDPAGWPGGMDGLRASINSILAGGKPAAPAPAAPAAPAPVAAGYVPDEHWRVDPGDTLTDAARHFGVSVADIARFNGIANVNVVKTGERIWPPNKGYADTWTVDPGDTLGKVSQWYASKGHSVSVEQLKNANGINNPNTEVKVGMRLVVP